MRRSNLESELKQKRKFRTLAQESAVAILRTADVVRSALAAVIEPQGITMQQYNVLRILRGAYPEPLATLEIGDRLIERTPGITRLLDRLEEKELVRRQRCAEDRRQVHCWITAAGLELLGQLDGPVDRADDEVVSGLTREELVVLNELLERVRRSARAG